MSRDIGDDLNPGRGVLHLLFLLRLLSDRLHHRVCPSTSAATRILGDVFVGSSSEVGPASQPSD